MWWIQKLPSLIQTYGPVAETILQQLIDLSKTMTSAGPGSELLTTAPKSVGVRDAICAHMVKETLARHAGQTGQITESAALAIIDSDIAKAKASKSSGKVEASGTIFLGFLNWLTTNGPTIGADALKFYASTAASAGSIRCSRIAVIYPDRPLG